MSQQRAFLSKSVKDLVQEMENGQLILSKNTGVWSKKDAKQFIKSIIDHQIPEKMTFKKQAQRLCCYDGIFQLKSLRFYFNGDFSVDGKTYDDLSELEKTEINEFQIPYLLLR